MKNSDILTLRCKTCDHIRHRECSPVCPLDVNDPAAVREARDLRDATA